MGRTNPHTYTLLTYIHTHTYTFSWQSGALFIYFHTHTHTRIIMVQPTTYEKWFVPLESSNRLTGSSLKWFIPANVHACLVKGRCLSPTTCSLPCSLCPFPQGYSRGPPKLLKVPPWGPRLGPKKGFQNNLRAGSHGVWSPKSQVPLMFASLNMEWKSRLLILKEPLKFDELSLKLEFDYAMQN